MRKTSSGYKKLVALGATEFEIEQYLGTGRTGDQAAEVLAAGVPLGYAGLYAVTGGTHRQTLDLAAKGVDVRGAGLYRLSGGTHRQIVEIAGLGGSLAYATAYLRTILTDSPATAAERDAVHTEIVALVKAGIDVKDASSYRGQGTFEEVLELAGTGASMWWAGNYRFATGCTHEEIMTAARDGVDFHEAWLPYADMEPDELEPSARRRVALSVRSGTGAAVDRSLD